MKDSLQRIFDEHETPTHASKRDVHTALSPTVRLAAKAQQQVLEYRALVTEATVADDSDPAYSGKLEMMYQAFSAIERQSAMLSTAARELAQSMEQLDRIMGESKTDIERYERGLAEAAAPAPVVPVAPVDAPEAKP